MFFVLVAIDRDGLEEIDVSGINSTPMGEEETQRYLEMEGVEKRVVHFQLYEVMNFTSGISDGKMSSKRVLIRVM